jgi:phospholipid transport system substrate-binding protein
MGFDRRFDRRFFLVGAAFFACLPTLVAATAEGADDAAAVVKGLQDSMLGVIQNVATSSLRQRFDALRPAIGATFDLRAMAQTCYGPAWDGLTAEQRDEWSQSFGDYVAASYAARISEFNGKGFERDARAEQQGGETVVTTRVLLAEGPPMPLNYVVRLTPQGWRIGDILANGSISELAQWRHSLRGLAANGDFSAAVATLRQRRDAFLTP